MTTQAVLDFVHEQRTSRGEAKVCRGWSDNQLLIAVSNAICNNTFGWVELDGKLAGFAFGIPRPHERVLDVTQVVCANTRALAQLMLLFESHYRGWTLRGLRRKKAAEKQLVSYRRVNRFSQLTQLKATQLL